MVESDSTKPARLPQMGKAVKGLFVLQWSIATALGWIFAHPLLQRYVLEAGWIFLTTVVPLVALVTFVAVLVQWRRRRQPRWRMVVYNTLWALVILVALLIGQAGSVAAVFQWLILRPYVSRGIHWVPASAAGALLGLQIRGSLIASNLVYLILEGALLATVQWLVLRRQVVRAGWWIPTSALGWLIGALVIFPGWTLWDGVHDKLNEEMARILFHVIPPALAGLACGVVTGIALFLLLKRSRVAANGDT